MPFDEVKLLLNLAEARIEHLVRVDIVEVDLCGHPAMLPVSVVSILHEDSIALHHFVAIKCNLVEFLLREAGRPVDSIEFPPELAGLVFLLR